MRVNLSQHLPHFAKQWHPRKNNKLSLYSVGTSQRTWWKCDVADDHEWIARIDDRIRFNSNCPYCSNKKVCRSNCLAVVRPDLAEEWHPTKNGNATPSDVAAGGHRTIWWKCRKESDHEWEASLFNRIVHKTDCPYCSNRATTASNCLAVVAPAIASEWHPTKNSPLTPYDVPFGGRKKLWWQCGKNSLHEWTATLNNRKNTGCPFCNESHGEQRIATHLNKLGIQFDREFPIPSKSRGKKRFDFHIPAKRLMIEYHGRQHYVPVTFGSKEMNSGEIKLKETIERDKQKMEWCKENLFDILVIPFWQLSVEQVLDQYLLGEI